MSVSQSESAEPSRSSNSGIYHLELSKFGYFRFSFVTTTQRKQCSDDLAHSMTSNKSEIWWMVHRECRKRIFPAMFFLAQTAARVRSQNRSLMPEGRGSRGLRYRRARPWRHLWKRVLHMLPPPPLFLIRCDGCICPQGARQIPRSEACIGLNSFLSDANFERRSSYSKSWRVEL